MKAIYYDDKNSEYDTIVMVDKIVRLYKSECSELTLIKLTNGEILESKDSIKTLEARINSNQ